MLYEELFSELDDGYTVSKLKEMIKIPSVVGDEEELAHYLQYELEKIGLETTLQEVEPGRPNVYGKLAGAKEGKRISFNGHLDTIPVVPGWDTDPFEPVVKEGRIYGLGSNDMKGGIACILNTLRAYVESGAEFNGEISFTGVVDEEAYGKGAKAMLKSGFKDVDAVVLAEPYMADEAKPTPLGITGKVLYDVHVHGRAAHGFHPEEGVNAIEQTGIILANLHRLRIPEHPLFKGNYCTLKIQGGYDRYSVVVPAYCRFEVNKLTVPGETKDSAIKDMEELVRSLDLEAQVEVKIKPPYYASYIIDKDEQLVKVFEESYRLVTGRDPVYEYKSSITDANTLAGEGGIPCIHLGPYSGGIHQKNEFTTLESLPQVSKIFAILASKYLEIC